MGKICLEGGLEGENGYSICCSVLDSDRFAMNHALWYHHRRGAWGTADAEYTFLLGVGAGNAPADGPSDRARGLIRVLLWSVVFVVFAAVIWGVLMLALR